MSAQRASTLPSLTPTEIGSILLLRHAELLNFNMSKEDFKAEVDRFMDTVYQEARARQAPPYGASQTIDLTGNNYSCPHCHKAINVDGNEAMVYEKCGCVGWSIARVLNYILIY